MQRKKQEASAMQALDCLFQLNGPINLSKALPAQARKLFCIIGALTLEKMADKCASWFCMDCMDCRHPPQMLTSLQATTILQQNLASLWLPEQLVAAASKLHKQILSTVPKHAAVNLHRHDMIRLSALPIQILYTELR
eukprot:1144256-Pelagomonas_calceolata.AAC.5